jgi:hypothetical protein
MTYAPSTGAQDTAKALYALHAPDRNPFLIRGRSCAALTIPALLPEAGFSATTKLPTPWQSLGSRGVNNLASKLVLTLFPPNAPFFRYSVDDFALEQLSGQKGLRAQVEKALNKIERAVMMEIESTAVRPGMIEALKQLIVVGNVLIFLKDDGGMRTFRLDQYVAKRDPSGNLLRVIVCEKISAMELPESVRAMAVQANRNDAKKDSSTDSLELYTHLERKSDRWEVYQEVAGHKVPGSEGFYPLDRSPWMALRFITIDGEDYGRGHVEELIGDLRSLEALQKAIVQASAAAAKVLFLVKANGTTKMQVLTESESGDVKVGNAEDVTVLQMEKYNDFRVALEMRNDIKKDLSYAFMLNSAIQRDAERVTQEEIRYMANELDTSLGGVYSTLSQELQLPFVNVLVHNMTQKQRIPPLPTNMIRPVVTTGVDAIGRGHDLDKLGQMYRIVRDAFGEQVAAQYFIVSDAIERVGASLGIDTDGLVRSQEEVDENTRQNLQQQFAQNVGPEAVKVALQQGGTQQPQ